MPYGAFHGLKTTVTASLGPLAAVSQAPKTQDFPILELRFGRQELVLDARAIIASNSSCQALLVRSV